MSIQTFNLLAQAQTAETQGEYYQAYALVVAMVVLGLLVICIPRPRAKHFIEPEGIDEQGKKKKK